MHGEAASSPNGVREVVISSLVEMASASLVHRKQLTHPQTALGGLSCFMKRTKTSILYNSDRWSCLPYLGENLGTWVLSTLSPKVFGFLQISFLFDVYSQILLIACCSCRILADVLLKSRFLIMKLLLHFLISFHREQNIINPGFLANPILLPLTVIFILWVGDLIKDGSTTSRFFSTLTLETSF